MYIYIYMCEFVCVKCIFINHLKYEFKTSYDIFDH